MDSHLLFSFYYFVCLSGYLEGFEKSWSALQSSHCSSATDADHKLKANTKEKPAADFFFSPLRGWKANTSILPYPAPPNFQPESNPGARIELHGLF